MPGRIAVVEPDPVPSISGKTIPFDAIAARTNTNCEIHSSTAHLVN